MDTATRNKVKRGILKRYELYKLQNSRIRRIAKDPFRTLTYFALMYWAYRRPFRVSYGTLWGDRMSFYLPEGNAIYYYDFFEANLTNFFINVTRDGDVFFDVGAHVGYYSLLCSSLVGKGSVHSFEPTPRTFDTLRQNVSGKKNVTANNNAVLDHETEIDFVDYGPKYSAFNSFKKRTGADISFLPQPQRLKVRTVSLDSYCAEGNVSPTIIKIDAEGAEHLILLAMTGLLTNQKPIVTIEVAGDDEWKDNCSKSMSILKERGYVPFEIDVTGFIKRHVPLETYTYDNLVFAHPDNMGRLREFIKS